MNYAEKLQKARADAKLSMRELSERAHVAASTVSRIESGQVTPTLPTYERLLAACGEVLDTVPMNAPSIDSLTDAWDEKASRPDWTRIRNFLDTLDRHPEYRSVAISSEAVLPDRPVLSNLLAGIAETIADDADFRCPRWTKRVKPLDEEWKQPGTSSMQAARRESTPHRLAQRRLVVAGDSLWRKRPLVA